MDVKTTCDGGIEFIIIFLFEISNIKVVVKGGSEVTRRAVESLRF